MSWSINTHDMVCLRSFEEVEEYYNKTPLPRGALWQRRQLARPLASNRAHHKRVEKQGSGYAMVLYDTALVVFYPNGSIQVHNHLSASSSKFRDCFAPQFQVLRPHGLISAFTMEGQEWFRPDHSTMLFVPEKNHRGRYQAHGWKQRYKNIYHPKRDAAVRKALRPFLEYADTCRALEQKAIFWERFPMMLSSVILETYKDENNWAELYENCNLSVAHLDHARRIESVWERTPIPNTEKPTKREIL